VVTELIRRRFPQLQKNVPELFESPGSVLYVGANKNRHHYMYELFSAGNEITVLEIWQPYIDEIAHKEMIHHIIQGDIREVDILQLGHRMFDYVFWWHGPEHIPESDLPETLMQIERITKKTVVLGSPWGRYPQGEVRGNPFEAHVAEIRPKILQELGYKTLTLGIEDVIDSNILAWKRLRYTNRRRTIKKR